MGDLASEIKEKVLGPVVLDAQVFDEICKVVCPHCRKEKPGLRFRTETKEFVHDTQQKITGGGAVTHHVLCWANGFRKSRFAEAIK